MPFARRSVELTVERELAADERGGPARAQLTATIELGPEGTISPEELAEAIRQLRGELDAAVGPSSGGAPARPDRPLAELIETYRPRQSELIDLLRAEGELTEGEERQLREHLRGQPPSRPEAGKLPSEPAPPSGPVSAPERPIAAAPLASDPGPMAPRSVDELIDRYQISSLRQAGAVRARRQISFEEYMALKRHFSSTVAGGASAQ